MRLAIGEHELRRDLAAGVLRVFVVGNAALWVLVALLLAVDVVLMAAGVEKPGDRIVDRSVVKTLVGATVVQVGIIMLTIAKYLFPVPKAESKSRWRIWG